MSSGPTEFTGARRAGGAGRVALVPGTVVGDGRYRLLAQSGVDQRCAAQLWRARDGQLNRDVALTVLVGDPGDLAAATRARRTLERAMHAASFNHPGVSRVLDVLSPGNGIKPTEGVLGMVVAEWTQGTDLVDLVSDGSLPAGVASRLLEPLAAAIEGAHHAGLVLGADHPQRIRVTSDGRLRLAFPGARPEATARDDVKGLGAILYLLLTGRWALPGGPDGVPAAPTGPDGAVVAPSTLQPVVPHELSSVAVRSLEDTSVGGIRTSAAILQVLDQIAAAEAARALVPADPEPDADDGAVWTTQRPERGPSHRRKLLISVAVLVVLTLGVIAWLGLQIVSFFNQSPSGDTGPKVVVTQSTPAAGQGASSPPAPQPAGPIKPAAVSVFTAKGDPDGAARAGRAIDGDPGTTWRTDIYQQQFPALRPGIGLISSFAEPVRLVSIAIDSPSAGAEVEIRVAPEDHAPLEDTQVIGTATLAAGQTTIQLAPHQPTQHVLVWITKLATANGGFRAEIGELTFTRAA